MLSFYEWFCADTEVLKGNFSSYRREDSLGGLENIEKTIIKEDFTDCLALKDVNILPGKNVIHLKMKVYFYFIGGTFSRRLMLVSSVGVFLIGLCFGGSCVHRIPALYDWKEYFDFYLLFCTVLSAD